MPKPCNNGPECAHLKTVKGCKFIHTENEVRNALGYIMYTEICSALNQVHCTAECNKKNIGGRMTGLLLDIYTHPELRTLLKNPNDFAKEMLDALEVFEKHDKRDYIDYASHL